MLSLIKSHLPVKTLFFIFILLSSFLHATIINVPADQGTIQLGIDAAANGDTVLVQPGTYLENINFNGKLITVASLFLTTQDTIYISQTVVDGNQNGSVVTFESGEDSTVVLIGFTITNGNYGDGGGIYCDSSNPSLDNLIITDNSAGFGGGIYCVESSMSLVNVKLTSNIASWGAGGGIYCNNSSPSLENVTISGNWGGEIGGGICCINSNPILQNVIITDNYAYYVGGGIYCGNSSPSIVNVTISDNSGGIYCWDSSPSLVNVTLTGNSSGIYCHSNSSPSLINSILWNYSPQEIYFGGNGDPNSITISYSDIQGGEAGIVTNNNGTVNWLEGNIDEDPLFVGTGGYPYSLLEDSPCIDAGIPDTTGLNLPPWDIIGNLRIWDGDGNGSAIIDMGAYEYGAPPYVDIDENIIIQTPEVFLYQNYPNPFNPETSIRFDIKEHETGILTIFNIKGQLIESHRFESGKHNYLWDASEQSSGIYLYKLQTQTITETRKMLLLK